MTLCFVAWLAISLVVETVNYLSHRKSLPLSHDNEEVRRGLGGPCGRTPGGVGPTAIGGTMVCGSRSSGGSSTSKAHSEQEGLSGRLGSGRPNVRSQGQGSEPAQVRNC